MQINFLIAKNLIFKAQKNLFKYIQSFLEETQINPINDINSYLFLNLHYLIHSLIDLFSCFPHSFFLLFMIYLKSFLDFANWIDYFYVLSTFIKSQTSATSFLLSTYVIFQNLGHLLEIVKFFCQSYLKSSLFNLYLASENHLHFFKILNNLIYFHSHLFQKRSWLSPLKNCRLVKFKVQPLFNNQYFMPHHGSLLLLRRMMSCFEVF